jgi:hypothetical protein
MLYNSLRRYSCFLAQFDKQLFCALSCCTCGFIDRTTAGVGTFGHGRSHTRQRRILTHLLGLNWYNSTGFRRSYVTLEWLKCWVNDVSKCKTDLKRSFGGQVLYPQVKISVFAVLRGLITYSCTCPTDEGAWGSRGKAPLILNRW